MRFEGKIALVTGGSTGIGAAVVKGLVREGASVAIASNRPLAEMSVFVAEIRNAGGIAEAFECDVSRFTQVACVVDQVQGRFGGLDIVVHCAGMFQLNPVFETNGDDLKALVDVNVLGTFNVVHATAPVLRQRGGGAIVCVASGSGVLGQPPYSAYGASKAAVIHMVRTCAPEFKGSRIRINCIAPGATRTPMTSHVHMPASPEREESRHRLEQTIPSPYDKPWLEPEDQADVILFLVSDAARAVNGACIVTDQGLSGAMAPL